MKEKMNQPKKYWMRSESLFDSAVREVVCEWFGGKILQRPSASTWQVELTPEAAKFINDQYHWGLQ
jgi:hypothetical protein